MKVLTYKEIPTPFKVVVFENTIEQAYEISNKLGVQMGIFITDGIAEFFSENREQIEKGDMIVFTPGSREDIRKSVHIRPFKYGLFDKKEFEYLGEEEI